MDILNLLKQEHKDVATMLDTLTNTTQKDKKIREEDFTKLNHALTTHATFEEQFLYPRLKSSDKVKDMVLEAYEEHHIVKILLTELQNLSVDSESWKAKLVVLKENVRHHVKEEEQDLFPKVKIILDNIELEQLYKEYLSFKEKH